MLKTNIMLLTLLLASYAFGATQAQERASNYAALTRRAQVALASWNGGSDDRKFLAAYDALRGCVQMAPRPDLQAQHCYDLAVACEAFGDSREGLAFYRHAETFANKAIAKNDAWKSEGIRLLGLARNGIGMLGLEGIR